MLHYLKEFATFSYDITSNNVLKVIPLRIVLIQREFITHLDGVNRFVTNLAEGFKILRHDVVIVSWSYKDVEVHNLSRWFREVRGSNYEFKIHI